MRAITTLTLILIGFVGLHSPSAHAELALDFTGGRGFAFGGGTGANVGWEFSLTTSVEIDGLGFWDHDADGLFNDHELGIWNVSGTSTLLASTTVTNSSGQNVASTSTLGQWIFNDVAAFSLGPGTYVIGANVQTSGTASNLDLIIRDSTTTLEPGVSYVHARSDPGSSLAFPDQVRTSFDDGGFGANFRITAVPEPNSFLLFATSLLSALGVRRQRKSE